MSGLLDSEKPRFFKTKIQPYAQHALEIVRSRVFVRIASVVVSFAVFLGLLVALIRVNPGNKLHTHLPENIEDYLGQIPRTPLGGCKELNITGNEEIVKAGLKKYQDLRDDKFTIAIQTYKRPEQLEKTLASLLEVDEEIPSLLEVVIVWNEIDAKPPSDFKSRHGVHVRYRVSEHNSLNSRLLPDPDFKTQAILLSDDDVFYEPLDLEFAFQAWRKYGRDSLTGAMARCTTLDEYGHWHYQFCRKGRDDHYNLMITNLAFSHIRFLDYYSSDDPVMTKIRAFVDDHMNCEDIAMNYVVTLLTGEPPLLVFGDHPFINMNPPGGISHQRGHFETRSRCLDHFADLLGCLPLLNATAHLGLGSGRHKWDYGKNNGR